MDVEGGNTITLSDSETIPNGGRDGFHDRGEERNGKVVWKDLVMAYRTLGVVFGGLVTSPLYVYPSMNLKSPSESDYLGIYSIIFWTLTLIGVVKYVCIALKADDQGEGGTFALYSLLCRHVNIGILPLRRVHSNSGLSLPSQYIDGQKQNWLGKFFERSLVARRILLFVAMLGTCMLIGDGILTPAISVLSAIDGLRGPFPSVTKAAVESISAVVLIALFMVQKFGTSQVSFLFSPIMAAWTITTPMVGIYRIISQYPSIFKAISPSYIIHFFLRNGKEGWLLLGGTVLCITGSEAMFADLGHFNKRSIQMAFIFTIYPSLVLTYAGQTAYLINNLNDHDDGFYKFIPGPVYWPIFIVATLAAVVASQSLISATFSVIKQSVVLDYFPRVKVVHTSPCKEGEVYSPETNYILMVLCVAVILGFGDGKDIGNAFGVVVILVMLITTILLTLVMIMIWRTPPILICLYFISFFILEGVYVSAVFTKIPEGGWLPFAISIILAFIMFGWYYGRQRKVEYEMMNKIELESLGALLSRPDIQRVPGLCFFYSKIQDGLTPILGHYLKNMRSLHQVTIFTTLRYLLVAKVTAHERIVVKRLGLKGVYGCVIQYGYADSLNLEGDEFVNQVTNHLCEYIQSCSDGVLNVMSIEQEMLELEQAKEAGVVHVRGKTRFHIGKETRWFDKVMIGFYEFLHNNCRSSLPALGIPLTQRMEVGMLYEA
ncbi:putative potassium transporter 17 [Acorus gramineus]|uniref:Potassium transporter n=1 Tax=Acorus gramineus TaxID=55184 RepID=A0AAV9BQI2_ACOGR|nr:putative potassium transporter 17 [Acorus gramineus]